MFLSYSIKKTKNILFLFGILCFFSGNLLHPASNSHAGSQKGTGQDQLISEYSDQIRFIDMEIEILQKNMDFLQFKIDRMENESRFVPYKMKESIRFKKSKIKALTSLRNRYQQLVSKRKGISSEKAAAASRSSSHSIKKTPAKSSVTGGKNLSSIMKKVENTELSDWLEPLDQVSCTCLETRLPILFSSASTKIPDGYQSFLKKLAGLVKDYDVRILIKGYADTDPINTRQYPSNLELGASRAGAIARALIGYGIKPSVFEVASTGEYQFSSKKNVKWKNLQRHAVIRILFSDCRK